MLKIIDKKPKEVQSPLYDYNKYMMKPQDRIIAFLIGFVAAVVIVHIFFGSVITDIIVGAIAGVFAQKIYRNFMKNRIKKQLLLQFRDLLDSLNASVSAGKVVSAAFADAEKDLVLQYGENCYICKEVRTINQGLINSMKVEDLLMDFGIRSGLDDIISFANVFAISNRRGGEIKAILGETKSILCDKIDIEQDIATSVNSSKNELNVIILMPLLIVPLMSSFTQDSANPAINIGVKIFGLAAFIGAYAIGRKITNIKV